MSRILGLCCCMAFLAGIASCKKSKSTATPEVASLVFPAYSDVPYDTTGVDGIFSANLMLDSTKDHRQSNLLFTGWFTKRVSNGFVDSATIIANGRTLVKNGRYFTAAIGKFTPATGFRPDTSVAWSFTGDTGFIFTYANVDTFPVYKTHLPDTIGYGLNNSFALDATSVENADMVILKLLVPVTKDSTYAITCYKGPASGTVTFDSSVISIVSKKEVGLLVSVFNHRSLTESGRNYLFIKEYTFGRNVWFK